LYVDSVLRRISMFPKKSILRMFSLVLIALMASSTASASPLYGTPAGTAFTYQGQLIQGGIAVTGSCDFHFSLWDALTGGSQVIGTTTLTLTGVTVTKGLFTVQLDFGTGAFIGEARWLEIGVKCTGDSDYTTLAPRQPLTPAPYALYAGDGPFWKATGNSGTDPVTNFLGTIDNVALEIRVNNYRVLRLESIDDDGPPNIIGGFRGNSVTTGVKGAVIAGGGAGGLLNRVTDIFGVVGGGALNRAGDNAGTSSDAPYSTVGGGNENTASGSFSTVGGGYFNTASGAGASVGGGGYDDSTFSGNMAAANAATIGGGLGNQVNTGADYATIGGGRQNIAGNYAATIGGGYSNTVYNNYGTVGGGTSNQAGGNSATVGGGDSNTASETYATIGGGYDNDAYGIGSTVGGGSQNQASGEYSTIPGGYMAKATHFGEMAHANGGFIYPGDAQASEYVLSNTTANATQTELFLDNYYYSQRITLASNRTLSFDILIVAHSNGGASAGYQIKGLIENVNGTTAFVGSPTVTVLGEDVAAWSAVAAADNTNDGLVILVTGAASTNIRWVASVRTVEVGWVL
jgi:hypothetical protein